MSASARADRLSRSAPSGFESTPLPSVPVISVVKAGIQPCAALYKKNLPEQATGWVKFAHHRLAQERKRNLLAALLR
jgi:hypothetical protein